HRALARGAAAPRTAVAARGQRALGKYELRCGRRCGSHRVDPPKSRPRLAVVICRSAMRKLFLFGALAALSVAVLGCPPKTGAGADAAADAAAEAAAPVVADAAPEAAAAGGGDAKNASEIARFPNETPIANESAVVAQVTNAHASPGGGKLVATLK